MLFLAIRRLVCLAVSVALLTGVVSHLGPELAARSMTGVMQEIDAAQHGNTAQAQAIGDELTSGWLGLEQQVYDLVIRVEQTVDRLAPQS